MTTKLCSVEGCDRDHTARGWCAMHYHRWWKYGNTTTVRPPGPVARPDRPRKPCSIEGCGEPLHSRGWCSKHYTRWHRYGDPLITRPPGDIGRWQREKTHCKQGHPLSGDNMRLQPKPNGSVQRVCRACSKASVYRLRAKRRAGGAA